MTTLFFCIAAFVIAWMAASRSLRLGLLAVLAVGYVYGILRANFPESFDKLPASAGHRLVRNIAGYLDPVSALFRGGRGGAQSIFVTEQDKLLSQ